MLENIERALMALGSGRDDVVRLRIYVTDIADFEEVGRAVGERYRTVVPVMTMVKVAGLFDPSMKVEIEADAVD